MGFFLFSTASRPALWAYLVSYKVGYQGSFYVGGEAERSHPSGTEVKNVWSYTSTPPIRLHGVVLS
jgi:hypothetical protein